MAKAVLIALFATAAGALKVADPLVPENDCACLRWSDLYESKVLSCQEAGGLDKSCDMVLQEAVKHVKGNFCVNTMKRQWSPDKQFCYVSAKCTKEMAGKQGQEVYNVTERKDWDYFSKSDKVNIKRCRSDKDLMTANMSPVMLADLAKQTGGYLPVLAQWAWTTPKLFWSNATAAEKETAAASGTAQLFLGEMGGHPPLPMHVIYKDKVYKIDKDPLGVWTMAGYQNGITCESGCWPGERLFFVNVSGNSFVEDALLSGFH